MSGGTQLERIVQAIEEMRGDIRVLRDTTERSEKKLDHTNGNVTELQAWRIEHEARMKTIQELRDKRENQYKAPIISGLVVGGILAVVGVVLKLV